MYPTIINTTDPYLYVYVTDTTTCFDLRLIICLSETITQITEMYETLEGQEEDY